MKVIREPRFSLTPEELQEGPRTLLSEHVIFLYFWQFSARLSIGGPIAWPSKPALSSLPGDAHPPPENGSPNSAGARSWGSGRTFTGAIGPAKD